MITKAILAELEDLYCVCCLYHHFLQLALMSTVLRSRKVVEYMRYYEERIDHFDPLFKKIKKDRVEAACNGFYDKVEQEYLARFGGCTIPGPVSVDIGPFIMDLAKSHGGVAAVYEECLRRGIPWYELLGVPDPGE